MNPSDPSRTPLIILRICLWLLPGFILTLGFLLASRTDVPFRIALPLTFFAFIALGYIDMRLKLQIEKSDLKPLRMSLLGWAVAFSLVQIIIAPAVSMAVIYGYFMITNQNLYFP